MESIFISDEKVQLILLPANELDSLLLNKLIGNGPVEIEVIRQPVSILGKSVKDAIIVRTKPVPDANKTEDVQQLQQVETHLEISR
jgi:hypothetical protein